MDSLQIDGIRLLLAALSGCFLSWSGSLVQVTTQNKLAAPSTLGLIGIGVIFVMLGHGVSLLIEVPYSSEYISFFLFNLLFFLLVWGSRKISFKFKRERIILVGLAFNLFVGAVFSIVQFLFMAMSIEFPSGLWFGNFYYTEGEMLWIFLPLFLVTSLILKNQVKNLSFLSVGENFSLGLGIDVKKLQWISLFLSLYLTITVISFFGVFSFLGLIFPHLLRTLKPFKYSFQNELLYGGLLAGVMMMLLDFLCYQFPLYGMELPVGMLSSVLGAFLLILFLAKREGSV